VLVRGVRFSLAIVYARCRTARTTLLYGVGRALCDADVARAARTSVAQIKQIRLRLVTEDQRRLRCEQ
jgi:hypothetical protein